MVLFDLKLGGKMFAENFVNIMDPESQNLINVPKMGQILTY